MSDLNGVTINRGKLGVSVVPPDTSVSALVIGGMGGYTNPITNNIIDYSQLLTTSSLFMSFTKIEDAEAIGFTESNDIVTGIMAHRHISEFFRMAGAGTKLYVFIDGSSNNILSTLENGIIDFGTESIIRSFFKDFCKGEVRQIGIVNNFKGTETTDLNVALSVDNLSNYSINLINTASNMYDWLCNNNMPANILVPVFEHTMTGETFPLREFETINNSGVSVICSQDEFFWKEASDLYIKADVDYNNINQADVGRALGTLSRAAINQNIGDNEVFDLSYRQRGKIRDTDIFTTRLVPKNTNISLKAQTYEDNGYIFGIQYQGLNGLRWNNDHVCAPIVIDADGNMNAHTIAYNRTMNEALRSLRKVFIPKVKTRQPVDPKTGKLPIGVIKYFEDLGDSVFAAMVNRGEISAGKTFVDPNSDLLVEKVLRISFSIVPYGSIGEIRGTLNLKNHI